jgi:hypothetical protein
MKTIEEINNIEHCECDTICPNCAEKHCLKPIELTGVQIADIVTKPKYYKVEIKGVPVDVIDIANAYNLSFMKGNAIKYILRAGKKDLLVQDLKKAIECLNREIDYEASK